MSEAEKAHKTAEDELAMQMASDYESVAPMTYGQASISSSTNQVENAGIRGVGAKYGAMMNLSMKHGRFFTEEEDETGAQVVVLDQTGVKKLFGNADVNPVGQTVRIEKAEYTVVGVIDSPNAQMDAEYIEFYMPFETCCKRVNGYTSVDAIYGLAHEGSDMDAVADRTEKWLASHFGIPEDEREDTIWVQTMESIIRELDATMASFQLLMTSVASISLVVGGIGIMNMMLTNVTERIREIGLRKALGARRRDITRQFLLESVCLTLAGGAIGIAAGYGGAYALSGMAGSLFGLDAGTVITPYIDPTTVLMVAGICIAIGIAFGYYPARRAARLDPVESLRYQ